MFLHLGENVVVPIKDIIGIFDLQNTMYSSDTNTIFKTSRRRRICRKNNRRKAKVVYNSRSR